MRKEDLALKIDQTLLKPDVTFEELEKFINENKDLGFYSLCIPSFFVKKAVELVAGVCRISTVIGFPHGTSSTDVKVYEATQAVRNGAKCVDVVINLSAVKSADYDYVKNELEMLRYNVDLYGDCELRIIIETCLLTDKEKKIVAKLVAETKCDVVKTSTGFVKNGVGAKTEDVNKILQEKGLKVTFSREAIRRVIKSHEEAVADARKSVEAAKAMAEILKDSPGTEASEAMIMQISGLIAKEISQIDSLEFENPVDLCQAASRLTDSQIKLSNYRTKAVKALDKAKTELKAELKKEREKCEEVRKFVIACSQYAKWNKDDSSAKAVYRQLNRRIKRVNKLVDMINAIKRRWRTWHTASL